MTPLPTVHILFENPAWNPPLVSALKAEGFPVELHYLDVPADELWRRIDDRNSQPPWDGYPIRRADLDEWIPDFEEPDAAELALFDPPPETS